MEAVVTVLIVETMRVRKNIIQLRRNWIIQSISSWETLPIQTLFLDQVWVVRGLPLSKFLYILSKSSKSLQKIFEFLVSVSLPSEQRTNQELPFWILNKFRFPDNYAVFFYFFCSKAFFIFLNVWRDTHVYCYGCYWIGRIIYLILSCN